MGAGGTILGRKQPYTPGINLSGRFSWDPLFRHLLILILSPEVVSVTFTGRDDFFQLMLRAYAAAVEFLENDISVESKTHRTFNAGTTGIAWWTVDGIRLATVESRVQIRNQQQKPRRFH